MSRFRHPLALFCGAWLLGFWVGLSCPLPAGAQPQQLALLLASGLLPLVPLGLAVWGPPGPPHAPAWPPARPPSTSKRPPASLPAKPAPRVPAAAEAPGTLPQATDALLRVLAQVLAPCRVGLFDFSASGALTVRASQPAQTPQAGGADGAEADSGAWPAAILARLQDSAPPRLEGRARSRGAPPNNAWPNQPLEAETDLWLAPIHETQRQGQGHFWGLLAVWRLPARQWSHADVALVEGVAAQLALAWGLEQALRISRRHLQRLERIATTDGLTELVNRRHFAKLFDLQLARARRYNRRLSLIFLDIDHFKAVNDTFGHQAGDEVLKKVAQVLRGTARCTDTVARLGGEEFAVLMEETGAKGAERYAERIRQALGREVFTAQSGEFSKTCSLGVATFPEHGREAKDLMARADEALYFAKRTGRNRTVIYRANQAREMSPPCPK